MRTHNWNQAVGAASAIALAVVAIMAGNGRAQAAEPEQVEVVEAAGSALFQAPGAGSWRVQIAGENGASVFDSGWSSSRSVEWNGRDGNSKLVPEGLYQVRVLSRGADGAIAVARQALSLVRADSISTPPLAQTAPSPVTGAGTLGNIPKWTGPSTLGKSIITETPGRIGIGTIAPTSTLTVKGIIQSSAGGFKFPDNSLQIKAARTLNAGIGLTSVLAGTTLQTLSIAPRFRLPQSVVVGSIPKWNGTAWVASVDVAGAGTITGVTAGTGLIGGGTRGAISLSLLNGGVGAAQLAQGAVTADKIADGAVGSAKLANGAVTADKLAPGVGQALPGSIGTAQLADGAVTAPKIGAGAVSGDRIADGGVAPGKIAAGAVGAAQIADNAVSGDKIVDGSVGAAEIAPGAVSGDKIADGGVAGGKIAAGTVGTGQIADGAISGAKVAVGQLVRSVNGLNDNVALAAGANITITPSGNGLIIAAPGALTGVAHYSTLAGNGTSGAPLSVAVPLILNGPYASGTVLQGTNNGLNGVGLQGISDSYIGVRGGSQSGTGVVGITTGGTGVSGSSSSSNGVQGVSGSGDGVHGESGSLSGVFGTSGTGTGVYGISANNTGTAGISTSGTGVFGQSSSGFGGHFKSANTTTALLGENTGSGAGVGAGVLGNSNGGVGVLGTSNLNQGVRGTSNSSSGVAGVSTSGIGVFGSSQSNYSGFFTGGQGVYISGNLTITGAANANVKNFRIDDPLDPAHKYLVHTSVESPDMMNIYNGVVALDAKGEAVVTMPNWFGALNKDCRYQLTCIGGYAPVFIAAEMDGNKFSIGGGRPGLKVSWQVTGIRHDAYADAHRSPVELDKVGDEAGRYINPELFGQSADLAIGAQRQAPGAGQDAAGTPQTPRDAMPQAAPLLATPVAQQK